MTLVLALSLLPGLLNADDEEAPMLKPRCVVPHFLLLTFLFPGGELAVVVCLPTAFFRWLGTIQNDLLLSYQMNDFGKVWPMLRPRVLGNPRSCQMNGRTISTNIDS